MIRYRGAQKPRPHSCIFSWRRGPRNVELKTGYLSDVHHRGRWTDGGAEISKAHPTSLY
jgi:hypothetical protein